MSLNVEIVNQNEEVINIDDSFSKTVIRTFDSGHFKPTSDEEYFIRPLPSKKSINIVIPIFNEEKKDLKRTLESLCDQEINCNKITNYDDKDRDFIIFHCVVIMDGFFKASLSMIEYISSIFGDEWSYDFTHNDNEDCTKIIQRLDKNNYPTAVKIGDNKFLNLSVIVKKQNRKKPNSHEWFFRAYIPVYKGTYAFATDCGTMYDDNCMMELISYLDNHNSVSAVTGRQRVMSTDMQNMITEGLLSMWYRASQAYDYEASISAFQGAFSLCGMLPVLPGPCGMFRISDIMGPCLDYYMNFINNTSAEDGIIPGNLLLAEDRILSYAACLKTNKYTRWVPSAIFYFEAETQTKNFIAQRRRWTNGTFACYLYLLFMKPGLIFNSEHDIFFKIIIYIQIFIQMLLYLITTISPGIFMSLAYYSIRNLNIGGSYSSIASYVVLGTYISLYISFSIGHFKKKFIKFLYNIILCWNTVIYFFVLAVSLTTFINKNPLGMIVIFLSLGFPFVKYNWFWRYIILIYNCFYRCIKVYKFKSWLKYFICVC